ncbi:MAG: pilus assembly protein TadG-related protein [Pseudomonadota bacterium]|nr:pilus assembly protein TadG-related protein [Pseudomonadota bacterium]
MGLLKRLKELAADSGANALAIGAAAMPLVIGGAGLAIDTVQISIMKRDLQRAADSAAIAGAHAVLQQHQAQGAVQRDLAVNNDITLSSAPVVENAPLSGAYVGNPRAVRVELTASRSLSFLSFFVSSPPTITVSATAAGVIDGEFCMLSLEDGTTAPGVTAGGNTTVDIGCGISTNSRAAAAITAGGSASIRATPIMAVGGVPASSAYSAGTTLIPHSPPQTDPFENLPRPTVPANCNSGPLNIAPGSTVSIGPGVVCYRGIDIKGTLNIAQGTQIIVDGGTLNFSSQANVSGSGVTFILTSSNALSNPSSVAQLNVNGGAVMNLSAPTSGPFEGVLFYEDPRGPLGRSTRFNGNASSMVEGAFYFPRAYFEFKGTAGMQTRCIQLVARRLDFTGNSRVDNVCPEGGGARAFQGTYVRLVE